MLTSGTAGETITAGMSVYFNSSTSLWMKADANDTAVKSGSGTSYGIAACGSSNGQALSIITADSGGLTIGGTTTAGTVYVVSATAGGICPWADLTSTQYVTILGIGQASNKIKVFQGGASGLTVA